MENNNRQGCRWDKNMDVRLKAWIERLLKESGILKHGLHPSVHESHNTFLVSIEETFHQEREKWLSIEPCATSSENYWKQRCEAAEDLINYIPIPSKEDFSTSEEAAYYKWKELKSQTPSPTGDRYCEELEKEVERLKELIGIDWKEEYDQAVNEIGQLQDQLKEAENEIRELNINL